MDPLLRFFFSAVGMVAASVIPIVVTALAEPLFIESWFIAVAVLALEYIRFSSYYRRLKERVDDVLYLVVLSACSASRCPFQENDGNLQVLVWGSVKHNQKPSDALLLQQLCWNGLGT